MLVIQKEKDGSLDDPSLIIQEYMICEDLDADVYVHYCPVGMLDNPQLQMIKPDRIWFQGNGNSYLVQNGKQETSENEW